MLVTTGSTLEAYKMRTGSISCFIREYQPHCRILLHNSFPLRGMIIEDEISSDIKDDADENEDRTDVNAKEIKARHLHIHLK